MTMLGRMLFLAEELHGDLLFEEVAAFEVDLLIVKAGGKRVGMLLDAHDQALGHGDPFGVDDQFLGAVAGQEIQHAGAGDHVDAAQRADHGGDAAFQAGLCIHEL